MHISCMHSIHAKIFMRGIYAWIYSADKMHARILCRGFYVEGTCLRFNTPAGCGGFNRFAHSAGPDLRTRVFFFYVVCGVVYPFLLVLLHLPTFLLIARTRPRKEAKAQGRAKSQGQKAARPQGLKDSTARRIARSALTILS